MKPQWANDQDVAHLQAKVVPKNLILSDSAQRLWSSSAHKILGALITPMGAPIMPPGQWPWRCTFKGRDSSNKLNSEWLGPVVVAFRRLQDYLCHYNAHGHAHYSSSVRKILGALFKPIDTPVMAPWTNEHDVAHLQPNTVPMNLIWSESAQCLQRSGVRKIPGALITPMGTPITPPWQKNCDVAYQQAKTVEKLDLEWSVPVVAEFRHPQDFSPYFRFQEPLLRPWERPCGPNGQMILMLHI